MKLSLKVIPGSSRDEISGWLGDSLKIRVRAAPESGKANAAVINLLAEILGLHKRTINIISGTTSTRKIVEIDTLTETEVHTKLGTNNY